MHETIETEQFSYTLELIFMERPDWADGLEAKRGIAEQRVHTHNLETGTSYGTRCQGEHAVEHLRFINSSSLFTECSQWYRSDG